MTKWMGKKRILHNRLALPAGERRKWKPVQTVQHKMHKGRRDPMNKPEYDMEMTPERKENIKQTLIRLWEDQMGMKLERIKPENDKPA